jgi:glycosyltransferase involved in cell wall biosynthesis
VLAHETGWLVPPGDTPALAGAVAEALALTIDQRAILAERAIAHARARFGIERMCDETLAVYREILAAPEQTMPRDRDPEAA